TAAEAGRIADAAMLPYFREGNYGKGILRGVAALAVEYAEEFGFELTGEVTQVAPQPRTGFRISPGLIILIALIVFMSFRGRGGGGGGRRRRRGPMILPIPFPMGRGGFGGFGGRGGFGGGFGG